MPVKVSVTGQAELKALGKRLKAAGNKGLTTELRRGIRKAAEPAKREVQQAIRGLAIKGTRGGGKSAREIHQQRKRSRGKTRPSGLRDSIARSIKVQATTGGAAAVRIRTSSSELPHDQRRLPRYTDRAKGWRHPVWGNREVWVRQVGGEWFGKTLKQQAPKVRGEVIAAMRRVAEQITEG